MVVLCSASVMRFSLLVLVLVELVVSFYLDFSKLRSLSIILALSFSGKDRRSVLIQ